MSFSLAYLAVVWTACLAASAVGEAPEVTLSHGGILRGLSTTFQNVPVDLFLGVRYALPPVGELRFRKPVEVQGWKGIVNADSVGNFCTQFTLAGIYSGEEDCLFLDITIPRGTQQGGDKKPVMVWIHGGGYMSGSGTGYIGAPLAVTGDVIIVTINYRVGVFGFLSNGPGTGNYGLWDQRAALVWVQQNIAQFGGDPDLVTIFGESAGSASVSAQTMGQHNDGLFKRAIQQSAVLFSPWSWFMAEDGLDEWLNVLRSRSNCEESESDIYKCLRRLSKDELFNVAITLSMLDNQLNPTADGDFFADDINIDSYQLAERFDLLSGLNGQEGIILYHFDVAFYAMSINRSVAEGVDENLLRDYLQFRCVLSLTPLSPNLCVDFLIDTYQLDEAMDDKERARRLIEFLGDNNFNAGIVHNLEQHSKSSETSTYAYYFTERFSREPESRLWPYHEWAKTGADHSDELNFVFGTAYLKDEESPLWFDILDKDSTTSLFFRASRESDKPLSHTMMLMWTNFAKSGNPNEPVALPSGTPEWPKFNTESNNFLEINGDKIKVITTPNKERLDKVQRDLHSARTAQHKAGKQIKKSHQQIPRREKHDEL